METKKKYTFRKFMNDIHLWLGIGSGIILFIICLTGTMYVFTEEITHWVDSEKFEVKTSPNTQPMLLSQLTDTLETQKKDCKVTGISIPHGLDKAWFFTLTPKDIIAKRAKEAKEKEAEKEKEALNQKREGKEKGGLKSERGEKGKREKKEGGKTDEKERRKKGKGDRERIKTYLVNPYTAEIQGDAKTPTADFFRTIMGLHRWLLLDHDIGRPITGIATLLFILIEITGLILWLPAKIRSWKKWNAWKAGFKLKLDGNWKRINYDLHNTMGFYTFLLITIMAITGLCFSFEWFRDGMGNILGAKLFEERKEGKLASEYTGAKPLEMSLLVEKANLAFPYEGNLRINMPKDSVAPFTVSKYQDGFFASPGTDKISFDQYSGKELKKDIFANKKLGEQIAILIYPIHIGEVFGTFTKIIYFFFCLIATSLPVTGTIIWINKLRKKGGKEKKKALKESVVNSGSKKFSPVNNK